MARATLRAMSEFCSQCGKSITPGVERCPHCQEELAVTLPGAKAPEVEEGKIPLPAPPQAAEGDERSALEELFDDFDPMEEFASGSGAGEPTLGGFDLTPPEPASAPLGGDDVLDFIDTGLEASAGEPAQPLDVPEMPELATEVGQMDLEEPAGSAPPPAEWPDYLEPPVAEPPSLPSAEEASSPPMIAAETDPSPGPGGIARAKWIRLLAAGLVLGGGVGGALLFLSRTPKTPPRETAAAAAPERPRLAQAVAEPEAAAEKSAPGEADPKAVAEENAAEAVEREGSEEESELAAAEAEKGAEGPPAYFARAEALEAEEKWEEALAAYLEAAGPEKGPLDEAHLRRSRIYLRLGDLPRALLEGRRAVSEKGERVDARLHLADLFERMGSLRDATETYEAALESHPDEPLLLESLGRLRLKMGAPWEAIRLLEGKVGADAPPGLRLVLGEAYLGAGAWARAERTLAPMRAAPEAAYPFGRALLERGKLREALPYLERAAQGEAADPLVHRHLGFVYKELGRRQEAARAFRAYLEAEPKAVDRREIEDEIATLAR